jgi:hypothetical protein
MVFNLEGPEVKEAFYGIPVTEARLQNKFAGSSAA